MLILEENSTNNEQSYYFKKLKNKNKLNSKQEKEIKLKVNISGIDNRQIIKKINEAKNWFIINRVNKNLPVLSRKTGRTYKLLISEMKGEDITTDSRH